MDNLISKDTVEEIIRKYAKKVNDGEVIVNADVPTTIGALLFDLNNEIGFTPSVAIPSAEPKTGHWIKENPPMVERYPFCSECGFVNPFENALNYCPNCGAKMD